MKTIKNIFIAQRFYIASSSLVVLFVLGFYIDLAFLIGKVGLVAFLFIIFTDFFLLFLTKREIVLLTREVPERLSNGDENSISIFVKNNHFFPVSIEIIDEIPVKFQKRDFIFNITLKPQEETKITYKLRPTQRGVYTFNRTNTFITGAIGLLRRRVIFNEGKLETPVYPSFLNMKKYEFLAISNRLTEVGIKRVRKTGTHSEFDQIKDYVRGDNYKNINWKATAKKNKLMVNQYQDEKSQRIYSIIDKGRLMKMPFNGLSLLDYSINSSLVLSNVAVQKHDKAGLITFNKNIDTLFVAERKNRTMQTFLELLYKQETDFYESNFEILYSTIKRRITHRSLIILYTNFESLSSLERQLHFIKQIAQNHLVLVIFFENTELKNAAKQKAENLEEIYTQTIVEKFIYEKQLIVKELNKHGVYSILTKPENLTTELINKYLYFKDRGLI